MAHTFGLILANRAVVLGVIKARDLLEQTATAEASPERKIRWQHLTENVKRLHDAGIPVALGTDAGMPGTFHGYSTLRELQLLVLAGLTPLEAIAAGP